MICSLIVIALISSRPELMCLNENMLPIFLQWVT